MSCPRCEGLMVGDLSCDLEETQGMSGDHDPVHELRPCDRRHNREASHAIERTWGNGATPASDGTGSEAQGTAVTKACSGCGHSTNAVHPRCHDR